LWGGRLQADVARISSKPTARNRQNCAALLWINGTIAFVGEAQMFSLFSRKPAGPQKPVAAPHGTNAKITPPSNAFDQMEVIGRCIEQFLDHHTFVGSLDAAPGYRAQTMPNGIQVATHRDKRIGVILDKNVFGMSVAGVAAANLAFVAASGYFKNYHKHEPNWQILNAPGDPQSMDAEVPFGSHHMLDMSCKEEPVDTQFDGKNEPGATLMITVLPKS
jgi:hypothetical protein